MHVTDASYRKGTEASPILLSPSCQNDTFLALKVLALLTPVQTSGIHYISCLRYFFAEHRRTAGHANMAARKTWAGCDGPKKETGIVDFFTL